MDAKVDVSQLEGRMLADASRASVVAETHVFEQNNSAADAEVRKIIVANGGRVAKVDVARSTVPPTPAAVVGATASSAAASVAALAVGVPPATRLK